MRLPEREGAKGSIGGSRGENNAKKSFNIARDNESEPPPPGSPIAFSSPSPVLRLFRIANKPLCSLTGQVGDKKRGVGCISNLSMLFIPILILFPDSHIHLSATA